MRHFMLMLLVMYCSASAFAQRQVEELNRGLIVVYPNAASAYISWRLLAKDDWTMGFNVYRSINGAEPTKLNAVPITNSTNFIDSKVDPKQSNAYFVRSVVDGVELETSETFLPETNSTYRQFFPIALKPTGNIVYDVLHVYVGDVDGDGDFDYIVKRVPRDATTNYILLECYDNTGVFKWKINLGPNVDTYISSMTAPVLVADFNGDGKAEIIAKTGEQTVFGDASTIGDTNGDNKTDYNSHAGSGTYANVMSGPEFISLINGNTGVEIDRNNFLARGVSADWGDDYGARMNFIMSSVCSFDGVKPGVVFSRGPGNVMAVDAWEVINNKLVRKWKWSARGQTFSPGSWEDFHQIQCIDVNGDGKDEISWGACMMNPNGTVRYTTGLVHGDRFQITDINPNRAGLEAFAIQQNNKTLVGSALYDASTGVIVKEWKSAALQDVGRGDVADIDPNFPGMEMFDLIANNTHASDGSIAYSGARPYPDVSIWWDADLQREFFKGIGKEGTNPAIEKWDYVTKSQGRLFTIYNDFGSYSVVSPYAGRAPFIGDILGDWREEIILEAADHSAIRIYTTYNETQYRIYTLMQNPSYRNAVSSKGYLCSKYTDYFLGAGMAIPPKPNIVVVGSANNAPNIAISSPIVGAKFTAMANVVISASASDRDGTVAKVDFYNGTALLGSDATYPYSYVWTDVPAGSYSITARATDNGGATTTSSAVNVSVLIPIPATYVYSCNACADPSWTASQNWSPSALPGAIDTAIVRLGEAKVSQNISAKVIVEASGIFRPIGYFTVPELFLKGGTLKVNTDNTGYGLNSAITVKSPSIILTGANPASVFTLDGAISGNQNLTKSGNGSLKLNSEARGFAGNWVVSEGVLSVNSISGLGACGAIVKPAATLAVDSFTESYSLTIEKGGFLILNQNLTVQAAVFDTLNLVAGTYSSADFPAIISGTGKLIVAGTFLTYNQLHTPANFSAQTGDDYSWYKDDVSIASGATYTAVSAGAYSVIATNAVGCSMKSAPVLIVLPKVVSQMVELDAGWNLFSIYVIPADSSVESLFSELDVVEIKSMDAFWRIGQPNFLNSLQTIVPGNGYLVRMATSGKLSVTGLPISSPDIKVPLSSQWCLIGCPFGSVTPVAGVLGSNFSWIKDFDGFLAPNNTQSTFDSFEPGKAYFLR